MVKDTQTIRRLTVDKLFERVGPFCRVGAQKVIDKFQTIS